MGEREMFVKPLNDMRQDLFRIDPPHGLSLQGVCFSNDDKLIYVGCTKGQKGLVCKYGWEGSKYVNVGCCDKRIKVWMMQSSFMSLSVSKSAGMPNDRLAVAGRYTKEVKIFQNGIE